MFWVVCVGAIVVLVVVVHKSGAHIDVVYKEGVNDNELAVKHFCEVISAAQDNIIIHDDGEGSAGSIYTDRKAIQVVKERLEAGVNVRCMFNHKQLLPMVEELEEAQGTRGRFQAIYLEDPSPFDVHFKIVDDGIRAYLSRHDFGKTEREYEMFDCSGTKRSVRRGLFGDICDDFKDLWDQKSRGITR